MDFLRSDKSLLSEPISWSIFVVYCLTFSIPNAIALVPSIEVQKEIVKVLEGYQSQIENKKKKSKVRIDRSKTGLAWSGVID